MPNYGDVAYWNSRYKNSQGETFDWLEDYSTLQQYFQSCLNGKLNSSILNLGCGNSVICEQLYDNGFQNIINIDISPIVIEQMQERNKMRNMHFQVMDALDLQFQDETFDLVIDKSTVDAILCGNQCFTKTATMIKEVQRILKSGGIYLIISYGDPMSRLPHLTRQFLSFKIEVFVVEKEVEWVENEKVKQQTLKHYIYVCQKQKVSNKEEQMVKYTESLQQLLLEEEENIDEEESNNESHVEKNDSLDELINQYSIDKSLPFSVLLEKLKNEAQYQPILKELGYL